MSFPWKKFKKTSISQLVKDHIHSQTPLIVETGFPSSLVDLFIKNRRKFMKTSKKKRAPAPAPAPPVVAERRCTIERSELKGCQEKDKRFDLDEAVDKNMVLIALLKIFLVVVLVLGTKKLVMGITMSAFLLYLFEYSGERVYRWIMPVAEAQRRSSVKIVELEEKDCVFKAPLQQEELSLKSQKSKMKRFFDKKFRRKISNHVKLDCQKSSEKVVDATIVKTDSLVRKQQNSASIVLLLVVLVGLIGGRIFALVFTVTWCMMSKQVLLKTVVRNLTIFR